MSETIGEPGGTAPELAAVEPLDELDEPTDTPAKIYINPLTGERYDVPTTVAGPNGTSVEAVEYDRALITAADSGDAQAQAKVGEIAAAAASNTAGVVPAEATPAAPPVAAVAGDPAAPPATAAGSGVTTPVAATAPDVATAPGAVSPTTTAVPDGIGGTPATVATPDGMHANVAAIAAALSNLEAAIAAARTAFGIGV